MNKKGIAKYDVFLSYINYYENLPKGWTITRLSNLITLTSGTDLPSTEFSTKNIGVPYLTGASNISNSTILINRYTSHKYINSHMDEILLTCKGTVGKIIINSIGDLHVARQFMSIKSFIDLDYTLFFLQTLIEKLVSEAKSIIPGIDRKQLLTKNILLPPNNEQIRIVVKLNLLMKIFH